jgi:hypothetical protein
MCTANIPGNLVETGAGKVAAACAEAREKINRNAPASKLAGAPSIIAIQ